MPKNKHTSARRAPLQRRARDTVEIIIQASAQILSREGLAGFTTNHVAERAGVSIGTLYQYFADKEALLAEVRRRYDAAFRERLLAGVGRLGVQPLPAAIAGLVRLLVTLHAEDPGLHNAITSGARDDERPMFEQLVASYLAAYRDGVRRPNLQLAAKVSLEVAEALIHGNAVRNAELLDNDDFVDEVTDVLVRYLVRQPGLA